ncbi:hypothetical protein CBP51_09245 [Cellvibrio mixtus]|uniref:Uncharacterized protein n=1 Tax=Cellvibrio mixtus TaxID=39650 RepID=A0A266QB92_9GAMM|nr:hypothetical protein [Cellvibrio mixtus]OZY87153.1 hypothetical protein CBP51_09245 [Cellvibrio mixtus]
MVNIVIQDYTGQAYELTGRTRSPRSSSAQAYSSDSYSIFRLVARLPVGLQQWVQILGSVQQGTSYFHGSHPGEIYQAVAQCVLRGDLRIYQLPALTTVGALPGKHGIGLRIIKGPNPHCATDLMPEAINSTDAAQQLLNELGISSEAFLSYLKGESLYNDYQKQNPSAEILNLLAAGELLAYKIPLPPKTPPAKPAEFLPATAADRPVPLAPESLDKVTGNSLKTSEKADVAPVEDTAPFKREHKDGSAKDPYTLQSDGKPLGAQEGVMPKACKGLNQLPENHDLCVEQGFPNLNAMRASGESNMDYANFSDVRPDVISPGTTLYRVLDEKANPAGAYWATALPEKKSDWRGNYAVKDSWNDNGYYTEYTVPPGDGLKVWRGTTAGQKYAVSDGKKFYLEGGREQIFISPNTISPEPKKYTNWTDARS